MDDPAFIKGACVKCGNHIEFPRSGLGRVIPCPHCGQPTELTGNLRPAPIAAAPAAPVVAVPAAPKTPPAAPVPRPPAAAPTRKRGLGAGLYVGLGVAGVAFAVSGYLFWKARTATPIQAVAPVPVPAAAPARPAPVSTNTQAPANPAVTVTATVSAQLKIPPDLKPGPVQMERAKDGGLVYFSGVLTNTSDRQRFGVRITVDYFNAQNGKIGSATDYQSVIEPRKTWRFRALVIDPKTASARLAAVTEN